MAITASASLLRLLLFFNHVLQFLLLVSLIPLDVTLSHPHDFIMIIIFVVFIVMVTILFWLSHFC